MKDIDYLLSHYMEYRPSKGNDKAKLVGSYYSHERAYDDPWFAKVVSYEYMIRDGCDIFPDKKRRLVLYSAEKSLEVPDGTKPCKYPIHSIPDCAYGYYGMKLNLLAYLSGSEPDLIEVYYNNGQKKNFRINLLYARVLLEHYLTHYAPEDTQIPDKRKSLGQQKLDL